MSDWVFAFTCLGIFLFILAIEFFLYLITYHFIDDETEGIIMLIAVNSVVLSILILDMITGV